MMTAIDSIISFAEAHIASASEQQVGTNSLVLGERNGGIGDMNAAKSKTKKRCVCTYEECLKVFDWEDCNGTKCVGTIDNPTMCVCAVGHRLPSYAEKARAWLTVLRPGEAKASHPATKASFEKMIEGHVYLRIHSSHFAPEHKQVSKATVGKKAKHKIMLLKDAHPRLVPYVSSLIPDAPPPDCEGGTTTTKDSEYAAPKKRRRIKHHPDEQDISRQLKLTCDNLALERAKTAALEKQVKSLDAQVTSLQNKLKVFETNFFRMGQQHQALTASSQPNQHQSTQARAQHQEQQYLQNVLGHLSNNMSGPDNAAPNVPPMSWGVKELREELKKYNLPHEGKKTQLVKMYKIDARLSKIEMMWAVQALGVNAARVMLTSSTSIGPA